jgi:hypothetical protein
MSADVARALGVDPVRPLEDDDLLRLFEGRRADDGQAWSRMRRKISAIDFTAQPHKSVTLAAEFAPTAEESAAIWSCIDRANDLAMHRMAGVLGWARNGKGEADPGATGWASFRHRVARPPLVLRVGAKGNRISVEVPEQGDPHAHIHNVLFNLVVTAEGRVGSLDTKRLTRAVLHFCGALFQAELAQLLRALGIRVECHRSGAAAVLPAVDSRAVKLFSRRSDVIKRVAQEYARKIGLEWDKLNAETSDRLQNMAAKFTRLGEPGGAPDRQRWHEQAEAIGWRHQSVLEGCFQPPMSDVERIGGAYAIAARQIPHSRVKGNVLDRGWCTVHATRALIGVGMSGLADIDRIADLLMERQADVV